MSYAVKEIFKTLQGEGAHSGRAAVFCRFSGCNLWTGREVDRATAICAFCDTDVVGMDGTGGGRFANADSLADAIGKEWAGVAANRYVVLTGGEPLLQVDDSLVDALHARGFEIVLRQADELKLVYPQPGLEPDAFEALAFDHFFLQPMDVPTASDNLAATIFYVSDHPRWRLSRQSHKMIGSR